MKLPSSGGRSVPSGNINPQPTQNMAEHPSEGGVLVTCKISERLSPKTNLDQKERREQTSFA